MNETDLFFLMSKIHNVFGLKENQDLTYSERMNTIKKILRSELNDVHSKGVQKGMDKCLKILQDAKNQ